MTVTIDPVIITMLGALILAAIGTFIWFGKLSGRVDRLESDVADLKQGQQQILELLHQHIGYHQGRAEAAAPAASQPH